MCLDVVVQWIVERKIHSGRSELARVNGAGVRKLAQLLQLLGTPDYTWR